MFDKKTFQYSTALFFGLNFLAPKPVYGFQMFTGYDTVTYLLDFEVNNINIC